MILGLNTNELATMVLNLSVMRKNVRKGFKSNYGNEYKERLSSYDQIKNEMAKVLEDADPEEKNDFVFNFNIREIEMLSSFINFYIDQINKEFGEASTEEDKIHMNRLHAIKNKVDDLIRR